MKICSKFANKNVGNPGSTRRWGGGGLLLFLSRALLSSQCEASDPVALFPVPGTTWPLLEWGPPADCLAGRSASLQGAGCPLLWGDASSMCMVVEAGPYLGADLFALLPYTYGGWPYHNGLDALLGPYYRCSLYFNTASFPVPLRNFMSGWWEEFYSWNLPHLGKLGLFWKKTHEAWDLVFPRIATDFPGLVPLELGPDTLNTLGDRLISLKSETDYLEEEIDALRNQVMSLEEELSYTSRYRTWFKWGCIAGAVWGGISIYNLFGRKKYSQSAIYRLKRL